ncbi:MAG: sporulation transcriptional regulator SpoIIID [Clostridia bacterium]|nr:sporulation transcriptional regulator SpoIIID [Clostridia bacterium]
MRDLDFVKDVVQYFNENQSTVRKTAKHFGISKSTVYIYLTVVMPNPKSEEILKINKEQRHIRGGQASKNKYLRKKRS